jgi:glycosyltransferase involved in cell wall biosynthesis
MAPLVSIVIATRNRERLLAETLAGLVRLRWPRDRFEIIVADNGSTDGTAAVVESACPTTSAPAIQYLLVPQPGKSYAVNAALSFARGDIIALTDDDVLPDVAWLHHLCAAFDETGADFVAGRIFARWETPPPQWMSRSLYGVLAIPDNGDTRLEIAPDNHRVVPIGANMAIRAAVVTKIGGLRTDLGKLDGTLRTGEDHEFFLRMLAAGFRGVYEPRAVVHHWVPRERLEPKYFRQWLYQNGRDVARLNAAHPVAVPRLLGVPRYLWREAVGHGRTALFGALTGNAAKRFGGEVRLRWLSGYVREAWFSPRVPQPAASLGHAPRRPKAAL